MSAAPAGSPLTIAAASAGDSGAISALLEREGLPVADIGVGALDTFLVARDREQLYGVVGLDVFGTDAMLRSLAVSAARRGAGVGGELLRAAEELALKQGVRTLYLLTTTAQKYFAMRGYRVIERAAAPPRIGLHPQFRTLCPSTAAFMTKAL